MNNAEFPQDRAPTGTRMSLRRYALLGARLRWRLVRNTLARRGLALFIVVLVAASVGALGGFASFSLARTFDPGPQRTLLVVGLTMIVVAWTFAPLLAGGSDETVDPTRLALLPLTTRQLTAVLAGGAASSPAVTALGVALLGVVVGYAPLGFGAVIIVADVVAIFALGLGIARSVAAGLARAQRSRRGRDVAVLASALAAVTVWLGTQAIGPILEVTTRNRSSRILDVLSWLPPGWIAQSVLQAQAGHVGQALLGLAGGAAAAAGMLALWGHLTRRMMEQSERIIETGRQRNTVVVPLGRASTRFGAAWAKEVCYLRRSPLRRTQLLIFSVMGTALTVFQALNVKSSSAVPFMALIATIFGIGPAINIIGFDSPSLWLEIVVGGPDRAVLRARSLSYIPQLAIPSMIAALVLGVWKGHWSSVVAVMLLVPSVALTGVGLGAFMSPRVPIPQRDGDNAFAWRNPSSGRGCVAGLLTFGSLFAVALLSAPFVLATIKWRDRPWVLLIPIAGYAWAGLVWLVGTNLAARSVRFKGPELLAELSTKAFT